MRYRWNFSRFESAAVLAPVLFLFILTCAKKTDNPVLSVFDGGEVLQGEYVEQYLASTKYKPAVMPAEDNLREIVTEKALKRIAVLEAKSRGMDQDPLILAALQERVDASLFQYYMRKEIIDKVVTDSLIKKFHAEFTPQYKMRYIFRVVTDRSTPQTVKTQKDTIDWIYSRLVAGESFEAMARKYSQDTQTREKGGDLGFVIQESLGDPQLRTVMMALPENSFSKPFQGVAGYYILQKGEKRDVIPPAFEEVRGRIWQTLYQTRQYAVANLASQTFGDLVPRYLYKTNDDVIEAIRRKAGTGDMKNRDNTGLVFEKLDERDLDLILATFQGGVIRAREIFEDRKKRPGDMWEFDLKLKFTAQQKLFAKHARELGYDQTPEIEEQKSYILDALLRADLYQKEVRDIVQTRLDSLNEIQSKILSPRDLKQSMDAGRAKFEKELRERFENELKSRYHFRFEESHFAKAMKKAEELKIRQNEEQKKTAEVEK